MKAKEGVVELLNIALTTELTAINQYVLQAAMCQNWGYERLYGKLRALSLDEMRDMEQLIKHILYLEGMPNVQRLGPVQVGTTVLEHLQFDLQLERQAVANLVEAIAHCTDVRDYTTRHILEEMIRDEETHVDWFETQLETIKQVGLEHYLSQQINRDES